MTKDEAKRVLEMLAEYDEGQISVEKAKEIVDMIDPLDYVSCKESNSPLGGTINLCNK